MNAFETIKLLDIRTKNILNIIQKDGPLTKNEILSKSKLKLTTLNRDMAILEKLKLITSASIADSTGGRKPTMYDVVRDDYYLIGIDVSRTYTHIILTNLKFEPQIEERIQSDSYNMDESISDLPKLILDLLKSKLLSMNKIVGLGVGVVHGVDRVKLKNQLETIIGLPAFLDNGANAAVICEHHIGSGRGKQNVAYIHCGVGIRTGVISSGVLIRSINDSEDALGHMIIESNNHNQEIVQASLETFVSINSISDRYNQMQRKETTSKRERSLTFMEICNKAESGEPLAKQIILEAAHYFSIGLTNFIRLLNPQLVILSGPLIQHSPTFFSESTRLSEINLSTLKSELSINNGGSFTMNSIAMGSAVMTYLEAVNGL